MWTSCLVWASRSCYLINQCRAQYQTSESLFASKCIQNGDESKDTFWFSQRASLVWVYLCKCNGVFWMQSSTLQGTKWWKASRIPVIPSWFWMKYLLPIINQWMTNQQIQKNPPLRFDKERILHIQSQDESRKMATSLYEEYNIKTLCFGKTMQGSEIHQRASRQSRGFVRWIRWI